MKIETLRDVVLWAKDHHQQLALCTQHCANDHLTERARMLLQYLSEHEHALSTVLALFERNADINALNTWCYEYMDKAPIIPHRKCNRPFADLSTTDIIEDIEKQHHHIIDLYRYLLARASSPSAIELLEQLVAFEKHEALRIAHAANRLEDI